MNIENPGFQDFRADASCTIRPQSLIGEKYVDCLPTQPRVEGTPLPPPLHKIPTGQEGAGEYLLPVQNTSSPVDVDLLGDIDRLPERERLTIILNELGAGLAGAAAISTKSSAAPTRRCRNSTRCSRSSPTRTTCSRNSRSTPTRRSHRFARCANASPTSSCRATRSRRRAPPHAARSRATSNCSRRSSNSSARRSNASQRFAEQTTPDVHRPQSGRAGLDKAFTSLPAFSNSSEKFFKNLGKTAQVSGPALVGREPLLKRAAERSATPPCRSRATSPGCSKACATPAASSGSWTSSSSARAPPTATTRSATSCAPRASATPASPTKSRRPRTVAAGANCSADGRGTARARAPARSSPAAQAAKRSTSDTSVLMARTLAVIKGATPAQAIAKYPGPTTTERSSAARPESSGTSSTLPSRSAARPPAPPTTRPPAKALDADGLLLNYLLGNE